MSDIQRCRKRLGRTKRGRKLGIIIPIRGEEIAGEGKGISKKHIDTP